MTSASIDDNMVSDNVTTTNTIRLHHASTTIDNVVDNAGTHDAYAAL